MAKKEKEPTKKQEQDEILNLNENTVESSRSTKCGQCGNICCPNCTADGDPNRCAKTRFSKCRICGCPSSSHYAY